ncbi:hypothetical protein [Nitrosospira sp. Is2]|uniref:hypothetical protein n=1 Tax=Nitrosospira sp. Is2 TaxID=3080532 RepID=UPI002954C541|nr:hypothetical protein [Nitrosospira sp. Is2]WON74195.1 hypothetical protein R5L00_01515 [Nitrosospira sp. Is2]
MRLHAHAGEELDAVLETLPVSSVWGIGRRLESSLKLLGVESVLRLKRANFRRIRDGLGITMQRTVQELNGEPWLELEEAAPIAKKVISSRSIWAKGGEPAGATGSHQLSCC